MSLYLIRHSRVAVSGLCYGQLDVPLAPSFATETAQLSRQLQQQFGAALPPAWCSPSQRCTALAEAVGAHANIEPRLMELNFGQWEGQTWQSLDGPEARHWGDHWQHAAPPDGESLPELISRVDECLAQLPTGDVLLFTHAGPIRTLWHRLAGISLEHAFATEVPYATLLELPR